MNKPPIVLILMVSLILSMGCAKSDWIQSPPVTADVTGVWVGSMGTGSVGHEVRLELEQQGSKATGYLRRVGAMSANPVLQGPIEGTVSGDVFSFRLTNGTVVGESTVDGEEMTGYVTNMGSRQRLYVRRVNSSPPPRSQ